MSEDFKEGLCGCCNDISSCLYGCMCYPCATASYATRVDGSSWLLNCLGAMVPFIGAVYCRNKTRTAYGIRGSIINDCCAVLCCPLCSACQMLRETKQRGPAKQTMS